jgi:DNA-directed RNA polymerase specialized sigma24 family protein
MGRTTSLVNQLANPSPSDRRRQAWAELSERIRDHLCRWCRSKGATPEQAEDAAAEVICAMGDPQLPGKYDESRGSARAFLCNEVYKAFRKYQRQEKRQAGGTGSTFEPRLHSVPARLVAEEICDGLVMEDLHEAFQERCRQAGVSAEDAKIVWDKSVDGKSHADIANDLGLTHAAARKRFSRAMLKVKPLLQALLKEFRR